MQKFFKKMASLIVAFVVMLSLFVCMPAAAAGEKTFDIVVSSVTAVPGDEIVFKVDIVNNPAIAAVTVTFHYDKSVMEYTGYHPGLLKKDTLAEHDGYVSVVYCGGDMTKDGTLFGMGFKVKAGAQVGEYGVTVKNHRSDESLKGAFANMNSEKLLGKVTPGKLIINYDGTNCKHKFGAFEEIVPPGCKTTGVKSRSCTICGHTETGDVDSIGHEYEENWIIDTAATAESEGVMSRHCIRCESSVNKVTFTEYDANGNGFLNKPGTVLAPGSWEPLELPVETPLEPEKDVAKPLPEPVLPDDEEISADKLIENIKGDDLEKSPDTLHKYLLGDDEQSGILGIISDSVPTYFYIIICVLLVVAIIFCVCFVL